MKLYHGSSEIVEVPEIRIPNRTLDYGYGFYTTTSFEQAEAWVRRRMKEYGTEKGFVNIYDFDIEVLNKIKSLIFNNPSEDWLDFVMANRTQVGFTHDYDIVYGPVANDRVLLFMRAVCLTNSRLFESSKRTSWLINISFTRVVHLDFLHFQRRRRLVYEFECNSKESSFVPAVQGQSYGGHCF